MIEEDVSSILGVGGIRSGGWKQNGGPRDVTV